MNKKNPLYIWTFYSFTQSGPRVYVYGSRAFVFPRMGGEGDGKRDRACGNGNGEGGRGGMGWGVVKGTEVGMERHAGGGEGATGRGQGWLTDVV